MIEDLRCRRAVAHQNTTESVMSRESRKWDLEAADFVAEDGVRGSVRFDGRPERGETAT